MFFDFLQKRAGEDQLTMATSLLKNVSIASSKVEELVKSLYRHVDAASADASIESVETRSIARQFFSQAVPMYLQKFFHGDIQEALSITPRDGKWFDYVAKALGGTVEEKELPLTGEITKVVMVGKHGRVVDNSRPNSDLAEKSRHLQQKFAIVSRMTDGEIADVLKDMSFVDD